MIYGMLVDQRRQGQGQSLDHALHPASRRWPSARRAPGTLKPARAGTAWPAACALNTAVHSPDSARSGCATSSSKRLPGSLTAVRQDGLPSVHRHQPRSRHRRSDHALGARGGRRPCQGDHYVESPLSSCALVHYVQVVPITVRDVVVPARHAEDSADLGRLGDDARLLAEGQDRVDLVVAACCV